MKNSMCNEILTHLERGELQVTGRLIAASNATLYASCTYQGKTIACIYKPVAGERPLWDFPDGTLAQREYAAFLLSHWMGESIVPPTVLREGPYGIGMVQEWIEIDPSIDLNEYFQRRDDSLRKLALFDAVINNTDRKIGHLIPTVNGDLFACDHGVTFHEEDKLRTVLWQWEAQPLLPAEKLWLGSLRDIVTSAIGSELRELITEAEITRLVFRIDRLLDEASFPLPSQDWPPVPWPPF